MRYFFFEEDDNGTEYWVLEEVRDNEGLPHAKICFVVSTREDAVRAVKVLKSFNNK